MRTGRVVSKRQLVHGCAMIERGSLQVRQPLFMTRRERAWADKLAATREKLAAIADVLRTFSALEDARTHLAMKATRERRGERCECLSNNPTLAALQGVVTMHMDSAVARSKGTAEVLDRATEALQRLAASLRDG